ncbi:MAG TPA: DUF4190 domain-containing protein [Acidimicrobiales bacterium]|nr:DUF4190 domain-containing protein [Acidimicrobiales bacterium]
MSYGAPPPPPPGYHPAGRSTSGLSIASMVLGICSIVLWWFFGLGIVLGILAVVFGVKERRRAPNGLATAGLVTGIIGLSLSVLFVVFVVISATADVSS